MHTRQRESMKNRRLNINKSKHRKHVYHNGNNNYQEIEEFEELFYT